MSEAYVRFELQLTHAGKVAPEWMIEGRVEGHATLSALAKAYGPLPEGMLPHVAFKAVQARFEEAALRKIERLKGDFVPPVIITADDI
jgi:hypothetical protein